MPRHPRGRLVALSGLAVGAAALVAALMILAKGIPDPFRVGTPAPDFELPRLESNERIGLRGQRGRIVLINFWATWCKPCLDEMPAMERLYQALPRDDFELLAISVDEGSEEVSEFRDRLAITFPILLDPGQEIARRFQTRGFPESFLIDRDGALRGTYIGPKEWDSPLYVEALQALIDEAP